MIGGNAYTTLIPDRELFGFGGCKPMCLCLQCSSATLLGITTQRLISSRWNIKSCNIHDGVICLFYSYFYAGGCYGSADDGSALSIRSPDHIPL